MTTYRDAGVDIDAQDRALAQVKKMVRNTYTSEVLSDQGSFGGLFRVPSKGMKEPVLVSSADGVGTKLMVAFATGHHSSVGRDLVHHCINDILVQGARPLFFLDYLATGRLEPDVVADVIGGVATACSEHGMALLGGETAEMPGFYDDGEYDLAGFIVGIVDRKKIIDGSAVKAGDVLVGLPSTGLHTNGYSLARKVFFETLELKLGEAIFREVPRLTRSLLFIKIISVVAPLMGLLGTVTGMIVTFQAITLFGTGDPKLMAGGISTALVTTVLGLTVAIPVVLLHTLVSGRSKRIMHILQEQSAGLVASRSGQEG